MSGWVAYRSYLETTGTRLSNGSGAGPDGTPLRTRRIGFTADPNTCRNCGRHLPVWWKSGTCSRCLPA
jgi:hypothetical protein